MSQNVFSSIDPNTTSGIQLAAILNNFKDALMSGLIGVTRPDELEAGGIWVDNSLGATPNFRWKVKLFTGVIDLVLFDINTQNGGVAIAGTENLFTITRLADDDIAAILKLQKRRIAGTGGILSGDEIGEVEFFSRNSAMNDNKVAGLLVEAIENATAIANGSALVFKATKTGEVSPTEMMRIVDGKMGIAEGNPTEMLHVRGNAKLEIRQDVVGGRTLFFSKRRATGNGQTLNGDDIGNIVFRGTDQNGADAGIANIRVHATENTTDTSRGNIMEFKTRAPGDASAQTSISLSGKQAIVNKLAVQEIITRTSANDAGVLNVLAFPTTPVTRLTAAALTNITGITKPVGTRSPELIFINTTGNDLIITNNDPTADENGFITGTGDDIEVGPGSTFTAIYDVVSLRWRLMGGSGGGGGGKKIIGSMGSAIQIEDTVDFSFTGSQATLMAFVEGEISGETVLSGITNGNKVGQELHLYFPSSTNLVSIEDSANVTVRGTFLSDENTTIDFIWNGTQWAEKGRN